jgi:hypothetical protein
VVGISHTKLNVAIKTRQSSIIIHGNEGQQHKNTAVDQAIAWITQYSQAIGDYCPHSTRLFIPHCYTKQDLFRIYKLELADLPEPPRTLTYAWFVKILKTHFPDLHMASKLMLGVCDECLRLSEARRKCTNELEKAAFRQAQTAHLNLQRAERVMYQARKLQASADPASCWSIIVDYTDRYLFLFESVSCITHISTGLKSLSMFLFLKGGFMPLDLKLSVQDSLIMDFVSGN